mmetsp:Transcript_4186/g.8074  ORF Transcript_4186/g.8074 Transcript_4186/m.8074 type:complete len:84 (+) Transcript_4186:195-446(+)
MNVEDQLNQLSPEKQQAVIRQLAMQAQQEALSNMMEKMTEVCFKKCAGTSVRFTIVLSSIFFQFYNIDFVDGTRTKTMLCSCL